MLRMHGHSSPAFFTVMSYSCKVILALFVILLQLLRELEFDHNDHNNIAIIKVKESKFATCSKSHFTHLRQYEENHCVYLVRKGHHTEKSRQKRDHACAA